MKKLLLLLALAVPMMFASCSSDPIMEPATLDENVGTKAVVADPDIIFTSCKIVRLTGNQCKAKFVGGIPDEDGDIIEYAEMEIFFRQGTPFEGNYTVSNSESPYTIAPSKYSIRNNGFYWDSGSYLINERMTTEKQAVAGGTMTIEPKGTKYVITGRIMGMHGNGQAQTFRFSGALPGFNPTEEMYDMVFTRGAIQRYETGYPYTYRGQFLDEAGTTNMEIFFQLPSIGNFYGNYTVRSSFGTPLTVIAGTTNNGNWTSRSFFVNKADSPNLPVKQAIVSGVMAFESAGPGHPVITGEFLGSSSDGIRSRTFKIDGNLTITF